MFLIWLCSSGPFTTSLVLSGARTGEGLRKSRAAVQTLGPRGVRSGGSHGRAALRAGGGAVWSRLQPHRGTGAQALGIWERSPATPQQITTLLFRSSWNQSWPVTDPYRD